MSSNTKYYILIKMKMKSGKLDSCENHWKGQIQSQSF